MGGAESSRRVTLGISACILGGQGIQECQLEAALNGSEPSHQEKSQCSITVTLGTHKVTTIATGMEDGPEIHWDTQILQLTQ